MRATRFHLIALAVLSLAGIVPVAHGRVLNADLGRWLTRDPLGYIDGANLYEYVRTNPLVAVDPSGFVCLGGKDVPFFPSWTVSDECSWAIQSGCWLSTSWGKKLQKARDDVAAACGGKIPSYSCANCRDPEEYGFVRSWCTGSGGRGQRITICRRNGTNPTGALGYCATLLHELIHARQNCEQGLYDGNCDEYNAWQNDPLACLSSEIEGWGSQGICDNTADPARCLCSLACDSCNDIGLSHESCICTCKQENFGIPCADPYALPELDLK